MKTRLTIRETLKLIELGVSENALTETVLHIGTPYRTHPYICNTFTLTDLLDILPKEIEDADLVYTLSINANNDKTDISYKYDGTFVNYLVFFSDNELIDAMYKLVLWCIENGFIETNS